MQAEKVSTRSGLARAVSGKRIRCFSTAFILAAAANIGASQGALGPVVGEFPREIAQGAAQPSPGATLDFSAPGVDAGALLKQARALPDLDAAIEAAPVAEDLAAEDLAAETAVAEKMLGSKIGVDKILVEEADSEEAFTHEEAFTPEEASARPALFDDEELEDVALALEASPDPDEIIHGFTQKAAVARQDARAHMRQIRRAIEEHEALAESPDDILEFEEMKVARWIVDAVREASSVTGVDLIYMMALADKESSLKPDISARTSSAEGLFQFIEQTWLECVQAFGADHGLEAEAALITTDKSSGRRSVANAKERERILNLRRDPLIAGLMAGEMLKRDRARIEAAIEREITWHEMYMAHFLGAGGAIRLLKTAKESPRKTASSVFPAAARANRTLFFAGKGRGKAISVTQFQELIANMIAPRMERYASLEEAAPPTEIARAAEGPLPRRLRDGS